MANLLKLCLLVDLNLPFTSTYLFHHVFTSNYLIFNSKFLLSDWHFYLSMQVSPGQSFSKLLNPLVFKTQIQSWKMRRCRLFPHACIDRLRLGLKDLLPCTRPTGIYWTFQSHKYLGHFGLGRKAFGWSLELYSPGFQYWKLDKWVVSAHVTGIWFILFGH